MHGTEPQAVRPAESRCGPLRPVLARRPDIRQAEQQLFPAELQEVQLRASLLTAIIDVYRAMGGGWVLEAEQRTR